MISVGIDVLERGRADRILADQRAHRWLFTEAERDWAGNLGAMRAAEWFAGRLSAKEAVIKVLGRGCRWHDIEILGPGVPRVGLSGGAARFADELAISNVSLSISHQPLLVVSVAVAIGDRSAAAPGMARSDDAAEPA